MVKLDLKKEATLKRVYKIEIKQAEVDAEVQRINSTTRAPEVMAEIKKALGYDAQRFANAVAWPIVTERELRRQFENDKKLHATQREQAGQLRKKVLATKEVTRRVELFKAEKKANPNEVTWELTARSDSEKTAAAFPPQSTPKAFASTAMNNQPSTISSVSYSIEATAQIAQPSTPPEKPNEKFYFEDLDLELQKVLRAQLQRPGDISAVIETPSAFLLFVAIEKTKDALRVASVTIPKSSYDEWLARQSD
jgi:hypothetical protein